MGAPEVVLWAWVTYLRNRLAASGGEDGYTTQTVIITAVMAALAIAVGAIITAKVVSKANNINLGG